MKCFRLIVMALILSIVVPSTGFAQNTAASADTCQDKINTMLATELRQYRGVLFGVRLAEDAPVGDIRYHFLTKDPWIKQVDGEWTNIAGDTLDSIRMDEYSDTSNLLTRDENGNFIGRRGILETRYVLTSALIPYMLQNIRALSCNTNRICTQAQFSMQQEGGTPVPIPELQPPGCIKFENLVSFPECQIIGGEIQDMANVITYCSEVSNQMLARESALLKLAVEYDAGYRSTLQFAGLFDIFLNELRWPMTGSIRQAASLIGQLNRIPCFLSSCDESPAD